MAGVTVEVENIAEQLKRINKLEDGVVTKQVNKKAIDVVLVRADQTVPEQSGALRRTGRTSGTKTAGVMRYGNAAHPYATNVHFGDLVRPQGGYVLPNPWGYDAADDRRVQVFKVYKDEADRLTRRL